MNGQHNPAFIPVPMFSMAPQSSEPVGDSPPARVRVAVDLLTMMIAKQMDRVAINDVGFHEIPGRQLSKDESLVQIAAFRLLSKYFDGELKPSEQEDKKPQQLKGVILNCIFCSANSTGKGDPNCNMCHGQGSLLVCPTVSKGDS